MKKIIQIIKNKWLKSIVLTLLLVGIIVCAYIAINLAMEKVEVSDIDTTKEKVYSISQETRDKLENLNKDITLSVYNMNEYVVNFAHQYAKLNSHIKVEKLDNLNNKASWKTEYGIEDTSSFMVISGNNKEKLLNEYNFYTVDYTTYETIDVTEEAITNGILDIIVEVKPKIYFMTGHNVYSETYFQYLQNSLIEEANEVNQLNIMTTSKVPDDCKLLIITALKEDIKELEKDALINYIKKGGEILLLADANIEKVKLPNFQKVLDQYGLSISNGIILEGDSNKMIAGAPNFVISTINNTSSITKNMSMELNVCLINPARLTLADSEKLQEKNVTTEILATASDKAFYRTDLNSNSQTKISSDEDAAGNTIAAILNKKIDDKTESKLVVFASSVFATNTQIQLGSYYYYALDFSNNKDIILNSVSYLTEREDNITIRKSLEEVNYEVTEAQNRIVLTIIFTVPAVIIILGIVIWVVRRRKR